MRALVAEFGRSPLAIYHQINRLGLGNGRPRGSESIVEAARRVGLAPRALVKVLDLSDVRLRLNRDNPHMKAAGAKARRRRQHWVWPEDVDAAVAHWCRLETVTAAAQRLRVSRYALDRILVERGQRIAYGMGGRKWLVVPEDADAAARDWLAAGGQIKGPRSTRYPALEARS